jgi:hypothetical protein
MHPKTNNRAPQAQGKVSMADILTHAAAIGKKRKKESGTRVPAAAAKSTARVIIRKKRGGLDMHLAASTSRLGLGLGRALARRLSPFLRLAGCRRGRLLGKIIMR